MTKAQDVISEGFISLSEVIARLGQSVATIERLVKRGELRTEEVPRGKGKKPERFYSAKDVDKLKTAREAKQALRPPSAVASAVAPRPAKAELVLASEAAGLVREIALSLQQPPLWLTPREAALYSGLPKGLIIYECRIGRLNGIQKSNRCWLIQRASLDEWKG